MEQGLLNMQGSQNNCYKHVCEHRDFLSTSIGVNIICLIYFHMLKQELLALYKVKHSLEFFLIYFKDDSKENFILF